MNKKLTSFFVYFLCSVITFSPLSACLSGSPGDKDYQNESSDGILVKFKNSEKTETIKILPGEDLNNILDRYNADKKVEYAEPNYLYHQSSVTPNDPYYGNQWYLQKIKAPVAWETVNQSPSITIAIIDSGIQITHPDLAANIWKNNDEIPNNGIDDDKNGFIDDINGWDFINNIPDPSPKFEKGYTESGVLHGTIVAGIAAAVGNNSEGVAGVTWKSSIMPLRVLDDKGEGRTSEVVRAVDYAIANGADIINFSFVGFGYSKALNEAIRRAYNAGVIVVAAGGNEQDQGDGYNLDETPMYPVCHDGENGENMVIGVAATDTLDQKAVFSSHGEKCIDIVAPGIRIFGAAVYKPTEQSFNKYYDGYWSGTSMATPMVSGALALLEEANPKMNRDQIIETLLSTTDDISRLNPQFPGQLGQGRLNVAAAVIKAKADLGGRSAMILTAPFSIGKIKNAVSDYNGNKENEFFAYGENFSGGNQIIGADVNGDGMEEIITGAGLGGGPQVRVFNIAGEVKGQFFAYGQNFRGGVNVAAGDVNGDGIDEIITGAGPGGGPQVRIFNIGGKVEGQFFAYDSSFRGGVRVAIGDIDGGAAQKKQEIITAPGPGGGPHIKIFDNNASLKSQFFAYNKNFRGGVQISAGDVDNDGLAEIITGAGSGGAPHVIAFEPNGKLIGSFYAYEDKFIGGVNVGIISNKN
jgi:hypothetical protein